MRIENALPRNSRNTEFSHILGLKPLLNTIASAAPTLPHTGHSHVNAATWLLRKKCQSSLPLDHVAHASQQIDPELVEEVDHVDKDPVLGELAFFIAPKIYAIDTGALL